MKRLLVLVAAFAALLAPATASAHPLGNFTVNRYSGIELSGNRIYVQYVLDLAEIPTFQLRDQVRRPGFAGRIARGLILELDGRRTELTLIDSAVRTRAGAGGLDTLRFEAVYEARAAGAALRFRDMNFASRRGWREIVVRAERGARIASSTVSSTSPSRALTAYPADLLREPLDVRTAAVRYRPGSVAGIPPAIGEAPPARESSGFESLVSRDLTPGFLLLSLVLAAFWGAAHALSPGHGKAIIAGYLVGTRGTARHAVLLGLIVTVTHTIGVFALGLVTLALSEFVLPEQLYPWLNLVSALLVVGVGLAIVRWRVRDLLHARAHARGEADEHHHHHHDHDHHHHDVPGGGLRGLLGAGISGGIVPCPTALVVLLAAISLHRVGYGLVLILAFSFGLAASITAIGLIAVTARRAFSRMNLDGRLIKALPTVSALVVLALGVAMTVRALPTLL